MKDESFSFRRHRSECMLPHLISYCWTLRRVRITLFCHLLFVTPKVALKTCMNLLMLKSNATIPFVSPATIPIWCFPGINFCTFSFSNAPAIQDVFFYTKTVDSVDGSFWLVTQFAGDSVAPENIVIVAGTNELRSSFFAAFFQCFSTYTKTTIHFWDSG